MRLVVCAGDEHARYLGEDLTKRPATRNREGGSSQVVQHTHISAGVGAMSRPKLWKYLSREATDTFYATEDPDAQAAYVPDSHTRRVGVTPTSIHLHPLQAAACAHAPVCPHIAHPLSWGF